MYLKSDLYKEFTYIYQGIHIKGETDIRSSHVSMAGFICKGDSYKELTCISGGINIRSTHISMEVFICTEGFLEGVLMYLWKDSDIWRNFYKEFTCIYGDIHI